MSAAQPFLPVAIVGGGPAGLTLARVLQLHGVQCRVYESEPAATARSQGGSLDLHEENGLWAVQQCGLIDEFNRRSRPEGDCMRIMDKTGRLLLSTEPPSSDERPPLDQTPIGRPEIDRLALRNLLLESLQPDTVQWGHALAALKPLPLAGDGIPRWQLTFKHGKTEQAAVLIGADGAWSRIRPILSSTKPSYTGFTAVDCTVPEVSARHAYLAQLVGPGTCFVLDDQRGIIAQMNGNDTLRAYAVLKVPEGWADDADGGAFLANASSEAIYTLIARYFPGWHEPAMDLMRRADLQSIVVRRMYSLPFDHGFTHSQQSRLVTAVGDAAHVMSVNGEGVNLAMMDAAQLALALSSLLSPSAQTPSSPPLVDQLAAAIDECERRMFDRSKALQHDPFNFDLFFAENGAVKFAELLKQMTGQAEAGDGSSDTEKPASR